MAVTRTIDSQVVAYAIGEGRHLETESQSLISDTDGLGSVAMSGAVLTITGTINTGRFYGPAVTTTILKDQAISFLRDGKYVVLTHATNPQP